MEIYVGCVLLDENERTYLIREEDKNKIGMGRWNLPGGSVDMGEGLIEAVVRETKEETGYNVEIKSLLGCYKCKKSDKLWVYVVFEARIINHKIHPSDPGVIEGKWFEKENFLHLDSSELVHPDMQLVYNIAIEGRGLTTESIKYIDYDIQ